MKVAITFRKCFSCDYLGSSGNIKVVPCVVKVKKVDANDFVAKFKCDDCHLEFGSKMSLQSMYYI